MPINKKAIIRYRILDELLSNRYHNYSLDDLTQEVNNRLAEIFLNDDNVGRRTIEKDIAFIEYDGFNAEIERYSVYSYNTEKKKTTKKRCLRYADPSFTIFKMEMTSDEIYLLREVFSLLGQFDGLPNFEGLERLRLGLAPRKRNTPIIYLTKNPLEKTNLFGELFTAISQRQVIELHYHTFKTTDDTCIYRLYPYLLREYSGRWYLYAARVENDKIKCFPLDRMIKMIPLPSFKYKRYEGDLSEIFEDIIGVSFFYEEPVNKIIFWVSDVSKDYVLTKPLHESQRTVSDKDTKALLEKYPSLQGGQFFRIDCKRNYELIRELCSFGKELLVLEPSNIQEEIWEYINGMTENYAKLRTKTTQILHTFAQSNNNRIDKK